MNLAVVIAVSVLLVAVLVLLHRWQRRIEEARHGRAIEERRDAEERGSAAPVAQHPQIDVRACIGCGACVAACPEDEVLAIVDGIARVIHGSRCVGHGLCAEACPVGAVKIGLGELAKSPDLPVLSERFETAVPGLFVAGELGGLSLIRNAVEQGVRAIDEIAAELARERRPRTGEAAVLAPSAILKSSRPSETLMARKCSSHPAMYATPFQPV